MARAQPCSARDELRKASAEAADACVRLFTHLCDYLDADDAEQPERPRLRPVDLKQHEQASG